MASPENESETLRLCRQAIIHCLDAIASDPRKFWLMGHGTGSRAKLLAAYAALTGRTEEECEGLWLPNTERYEAYCEQREADERLIEESRSGDRVSVDDSEWGWELAEWTTRLLDALGGPDSVLRLGFTEPERERFLSTLPSAF
jgi:hypothetical protein